MAESIESMTLQEKVKKTEQLMRELIEHLDLGFSPKLKKLQKISRVGKSQSQLEEIGDLTIRTHVALVLESEKFSQELFAKLTLYTSAIESDMDQVLYGE
jgi:hypothetical protein